MSESIKKVKQVCKCENCGNEAEMVVTCSLEDVNAQEASGSAQETRKVKGTATCTHCGNEADMWVDL